MNVPPSKRPRITIVSDSPEAFEQGRAYIARLAGASDVSVTRAAPENTDGLVTAATDSARIYMPASELVGIERERERAAKELEKARGDLARLETKLQDAEFVSKAPARVVDAERARADKARALIENLEASRL
jgi:valyl-tRNA synthetase